MTIKHRIGAALRKVPFLERALFIKNIVKARPSALKKIRLLRGFYKDVYAYTRLAKNPKATIEKRLLKPSLYDKTETTPMDPIYFFQDVWCAEKVFEAKPERHYDIGSEVQMLGIISRVVPVTMIDIRPLPLELPGLDFQKGDILDLPFKRGGLDSLSAICVIEHIGLGRYGDPLDPFGTEKAAKEMTRVLAKGGNLYISVPIDKENCMYFNSHRAFTPDYVKNTLFKDLELVEEEYIYGYKKFPHYDASKGFGTGLYHFRK